MINALKQILKRQSGLSLIELSVGLIILGLVATPIIDQMLYESKQVRQREASGRLFDVQERLNLYHQTGNGEFPCPANLTIPLGTAQAGNAVDCSDLTAFNTCSISSITADGVCTTSSDPNEAIIIGAVPFATLNISEVETVDPWGNKIIYAVTFLRTNSVTYTASAPQIVVQYRHNQTGVVTTDSDRMEHLLLSTGTRGTGGFRQSGQYNGGCDVSTIGLEYENCDYDNTFMLRDGGVDNTNTASDVEGLFYFDDYLLAQEYISKQLWFPHPENSVYVAAGDKPIIMTSAAKVGIGPDVTSPSQTLDVDGRIFIDNSLGGGDVRTNKLCAGDDSTCLNTESITGVSVDMKCEPEADVFEPLLGYRNAIARCASVSELAIPVAEENIQAGYCIDGAEVVFGFNADGTQICGRLPE